MSAWVNQAHFRPRAASDLMRRLEPTISASFAEIGVALAADGRTSVGDEAQVAARLAPVGRRQGRLMGRMEALGFDLCAEALLATLTEEALALAHLWFVTIHPFDDGNGRIARAIAEMALARSDESAQRFYSMSAQIRAGRKAYYDRLEAAQRGDLDVTAWITWFLDCLERALERTETALAGVLRKARFWISNLL